MEVPEEHSGTEQGTDTAREGRAGCGRSSARLLWEALRPTSCWTRRRRSDSRLGNETDTRQGSTLGTCRGFRFGRESGSGAVGGLRAWRRQLTRPLPGGPRWGPDGHIHTASLVGTRGLPPRNPAQPGQPARRRLPLGRVPIPRPLGHYSLRCSPPCLLGRLPVPPTPARENRDSDLIYTQLGPCSGHTAQSEPLLGGGEQGPLGALGGTPAGLSGARRRTQAAAHLPTPAPLGGTQELPRPWPASLGQLPDRGLDCGP